MQIDFSLPHNFMSKILILVKQILVWKIQKAGLSSKFVNLLKNRSVALSIWAIPNSCLSNGLRHV